ncbi:serine/threonine-protein kinase ATR-like isoform X1 [Polistes fuscatus]|uniref:serine/threonine-protein kinase ATR-like isoform X1 n=2 Tax=Polistes fuscatus TaxID=30207 RepID=UPI001CA9524A|nr:serine/threonine-protein kinase ATR-like isoform X1 [Polistes fuscatus]
MDEDNSQMVILEDNDGSGIAEPLWSFIHSPVVTVFADYKNEMAEPMLHSLLESLIKRSSNLKMVLLPSNPDLVDASLFQQYDAFAVWLFGAMFYIVGYPLSERTLTYSINIQASMLTTLSIHNIVTFQRICPFYVSMLKDIQNFIASAGANDSLILNKFIVIEDIIPSLKLTQHPVTVNFNSIGLVLNSILQIIIQSGTSNWNNDELWNILLKIIEIANVSVKLKVLKLCVNLLIYVDEQNPHISLLINHVMEIIKIIPTWFDNGIINKMTLNEYFETFVEFIGGLFVIREVNTLCFFILDLFLMNINIMSFIEDKIQKKLREEICEKIRQYLIKEPTICRHTEANKYISYFRFCPEFIPIFMSYIYFEIEEYAHISSPISIYDKSDAWKLLINKISLSIKNKVFIETKILLVNSLFLEHWLIKQKLDVILYDNYASQFLQELRNEIINDNGTNRDFILESMLYLIFHKECKQDFVRTFSTLPFIENFKELNVNQRIIKMIKYVNKDTAIKIITTLCSFGKVENILQVIYEFIVNKDLLFAVTGIKSSIELIKRNDGKLEDICKFVLEPALLSGDQVIQTTLAKILGCIVCTLANGFNLFREIKYLMIDQPACKYCIENLQDIDKDKFYKLYFIKEHEEQLLTPYYQLFKSMFSDVRVYMAQNSIHFANHMKSFSSNDIVKLWLPCINDSNIHVRQNLAIIIGQILNIRIQEAKKAGAKFVDEIPPDLKEFVNLVMDAMMETLIEALETTDSDLPLNILLQTARNFGCVPLYATECKIAYIFLLTILHHNSSPAVVTTAINAYEELASFLNIKPKMLYIRYKREFLTLMVQQAFLNYYDFSYNISTSLHRAAKCIGYTGSHELISKEGHHVICYLLPYILDITVRDGFLPDIAELLETNEKQMLIEYFPHICSYVFLNIPLNIGLVCLKNVSLLTDTSIQELTTNSFVIIFENLMLNFHNTPEKIIGFLKILSQFDTITTPDLNSKENINSYLNLRLHGILVKYDVNLSSKSDEWTQKTSLASLATLMRFMGAEHITIYRFKILATLRVLLDFKRPGFGPLICDAWDAFIHNIPMEDLGPLIPTICIFMIPLLENYYEKVSKMLEFLLRKNDITSNYISELFFIDDLKTPSHISDIIKKQILQTQSKGFTANLQLWLKRITHETDEIRMLALQHLKKFLAEHRIELNEMILSDTDVHSSIVELLDTLLAGCQEKDENIRLLYGECLGELGAIEPSLLPRKIISREDSKFIFDMNEEFACAMLSENVRAFQMQKSTQNMDCFALAIQEILKAYNIRPEGKQSKLWKNLPSTMQQIIFPFLTSHYSITVKADVRAFPQPIYGSEAGSCVEEWAYNWLCSISNHLKDNTLFQMMLACRPAFKRDIKTIIFALPYLVAYVVANATEEHIHDELRREMLAVINVREQPTLNQELFLHRPLRSEYNIRMNEKQISDEARRMRCSQIVFSVLDHLQRWLRERRLHRDNKFKLIQTFCSKLDNLVIAEGCYRSQEFHRALMYLELHMASSGKGLSEVAEGDLLSKIYAKLDEPDGVSGILVSQNKTPALKQLLLAHEVSGDLQDAAVCYERLAQKEVFKFKYLQGMIECYLGLNQHFTATHIAGALLSYRPELEPLIIDNEPFWRLAQGTYEHELQRHKNKDMKSMLLRDLERGIKLDFSTTKKKLVSLLEVASRPGGYQQAYSYIMKLHVLNEFDKATSLMITDVKQVPLIFEEWDKRDQLLTTSRGIEFVLGMRRAILDIALELYKRKDFEEDNLQLKQEIGKLWLKSAKIARKTGFHQQSYMHLLSATDFCPPQEVAIEQAQLYWIKGNREHAFTTLKHCFTHHFKPVAVYKQMPLDECIEERKQCAKAKLLFARYNDQTLNVDTDISIANYKEAIEVWRAWEKSLLACAQYYDSVVNRISDDERDVKGRDLQVHMMNYYGKSLMYGCKYIHQSMPRMLTIWLDFASRLSATRGSHHGELDYISLRQDSLVKMTKIMDVYSERLPLFMWLTAFSQLVSRICHPSKEVHQTLCTLLVKLIVAFPQHSLWMMASVINSSVPIRHRRCQEILNHSKLKTTEMIKLIKDFNNLWERLIELSNKHINDRVQNVTVSQLSRNLPRLFLNPNFSKIMIPATKFRQLNLPSKNACLDNYNPFSSNFAHIVGIEDDVVVMKSLQKPRRIGLKGSDGNKYLFMCKPKDDLRIDFRLMEFNGIVNKYLQKNPESRQRRLYIRTYSVVPLNEECGLIEWVPNLVGLRPILMSTYEEMGIAMQMKELKQILCSLNDPLAKKKEVFLNKLLPRHPPVLSEWFRLTFPDPYGWYEARTAYIRTTAVMSMVGYILGLGDRHGENILFDSKCGDCVHVDFNCLFNRGEYLDWAERVPFRLTHNMIDAMGPLGVEGPFRIACQTTMSVLREQSSTLLSVLTPFVYDPLVSWNKNQTGATGEKPNEKAVESIKNINRRLKGLVRSQGKKLENIALNLSVSGQVNQLILDATNIDNLCQMYFGWGAFM